MQNKEIPSQSENIQYRKLKIAIDLDDSLFDVAEAIARSVRLGLKIPFTKEDFNSYFLRDVSAIKNHPRGIAFSEEVFLRDFIYRFSRPFPKAVDYLNSWKKEGHILSFPTARPLSLVGLTQKQLVEAGLNWAFSKTVFNDSQFEREAYKNEFVKRNGINVLIEDHVKTIKLVGSQNTLVLAMKCSWNCEEDLGDYARIVNHWDEINVVVQKLARKPIGYLIPNQKLRDVA